MSNRRGAEAIPPWVNALLPPSSYSATFPSTQRCPLFDEFRVRRGPGLHLLEVRDVDTHDGAGVLILAVHRQQGLIRNAFWLLRGNLDGDAAVPVQFHPGVLAHAVFLAVVRDEEAVLGVVERDRPECRRGRQVGGRGEPGVSLELKVLIEQMREQVQNIE